MAGSLLAAALAASTSLLIGRTIKDVGKDVGRAIPTQTFLETGLKAVMTRELVNKSALNARIRMKIFFVSSRSTRKASRHSILNRAVKKNRTFGLLLCTNSDIIDNRVRRN